MYTYKCIYIYIYKYIYTCIYIYVYCRHVFIELCYVSRQQITTKLKNLQVWNKQLSFNQYFHITGGRNNLALPLHTMSPQGSVVTNPHVLTTPRGRCKYIYIYIYICKVCPQECGITTHYYLTPSRGRCTLIFTVCKKRIYESCPLKEVVSRLLVISPLLVKGASLKLRMCQHEWEYLQ